MIGVEQSTLRYWETVFSELQPRRSKGNQRFYSVSDIELLEIISYLLYQRGMKIEIVKEQLKRNKSNITKKLKIIAKLKETRDDLKILLQSLNLRGEKIGIEPFDK